MNLLNFRLLPLLLIATLGFSPVAYSEANLDALRAREKKVQDLVTRVMPAIVCITNAQANGTGSGVVISKDGLILTAGHVTQATGKDLEIIFPDGKRTKATALGANYGCDTGLAKINEPGEWPYAEMGDSNKLALGDWLVAMGHSGGFNADRKPPVRLGRVWKRDPEGGIFSDCTLIGGDSGGPLFDLEGKVIGINSSINASADHNRHIAVDTFLGDWEDLMASKVWGDLRMSGNDFKRPKLGLTFDNEVHEGGAKILGITENTPTAKLGFKEGDLITKFESTNINNNWSLMRELSDCKIGQIVKVEVKRGEETVGFEVELLNREGKSKQQTAEDRPREKRRHKNTDADPVAPEPPSGPRPYFGAALETATDGAEVKEITPDSPAAKAGLKSGDILRAIDDKPITDAIGAAGLIRPHQPGDKISLTIKRGSEELKIELTLDKK